MNGIIMNTEREMKKQTHPVFFDIAERTEKLTEMGDPLVGLKAHIDWEVFCTDLNNPPLSKRPGGATHEKRTPLLKKM